MKLIQKLIPGVLLVTLILVFSMFLYPASAQAPIVMKCGDTIESVFTSDIQTHIYSLNARSGMKLIIYAVIKIGNYETLTLDTGLRAPNGFEIDSTDPYNTDKTRTIATDWLSVDGTYEISIVGRTNTGGAYMLSVACVYEDGTVTSNINLVQTARCGSIIDNTIERDFELHRYYLVLNRGDQIKLVAASIAGNYETLTVDTGLYAPNNFEIEPTDPYNTDKIRTIETAALSNTGIYLFAVVGRTSTTGDYEIQITCTLADGTVVNPGDVPPVNLSTPEPDMAVPPPTPAFSGFGFPGLAPVDFASAFRLPMTAGIPSEGEIPPAGNAVLGFYLSGNAGDVVDLSFERISGNLNLGLVVLSSDNQVAFMSALVSSQSLSTRFVLPSTGEYTFGVFRVDLIPPATPEPTKFKMQVALNP